MSVAAGTVTISNELGLHARSAMTFTEMAGRYVAAITVTRPDTGESADGKAMLSLLQLILVQGTLIEIRADGDDAEAALVALVALVEDGFGET